MYFAFLMGTFVIGIAAMLGIMGVRQWTMGYRVAGGVSLVVTALITVAGIVGAWFYFQ